MDNLKLNVHHNYDYNCDGHSYLKGMSVIQLSFLIEILKEIYEWSLDPNASITNNEQLIVGSSRPLGLVFGEIQFFIDFVEL